MKNKNFCGSCRWFKDEDIFGHGICYIRERCMHCSAKCNTDEYVSNEESRHYIAVLIQANRYRRDNNVPSIYRMPDPKELGKAIDFAVKFMNVFENI